MRPSDLSVIASRRSIALTFNFGANLNKIVVNMWPILSEITTRPAISISCPFTTISFRW